jgi:hypothetical protein
MYCTVTVSECLCQVNSRSVTCRHDEMCPTLAYGRALSQIKFTVFYFTLLKTLYSVFTVFRKKIVRLHIYSYTHTHTQTHTHYFTLEFLRHVSALIEPYQGGTIQGTVQNTWVLVFIRECNSYQYIPSCTRYCGTVLCTDWQLNI